MAADVREKEQLEYLFLDLEWNQAPGTTGLDGRKAIQIGVVAADIKIQKTKIFSKAIRLSDPSLFNEKTEIVTHTPVFLQEVLSVITGNVNEPIGFEKALTCAGIKYASNYLHYAKHDADYLYQLYCRCFQQYNSVTAEERCFANETTRKLHTENCRYVKDIAVERKSIVPKSMIFKGYTVCKCCGKSQIWKQLEWEFVDKYRIQNKKYRDDLKQLPLTETNIEKICKYFQLSYSITSDTVFVRTAFSRWIVYLQKDKVKKLLHENYRICKSQYLKNRK